MVAPEIYSIRMIYIACLFIWKQKVHFVSFFPVWKPTHVIFYAFTVLNRWVRTYTQHECNLQQHGNKQFHSTIANSKGVYFSLLVAQSKP